MSKRNSLNTSGANSSNTLFNYFAKSPVTPKSTQNNTPLTKAKVNESPLSAFSPKSRTPLNKKSLDFGKQYNLHSLTFFFLSTTTNCVFVF